MLNEILNTIKNIITSDLLFIIIDITLSTLMTIFGILLYNKTRKIGYLFFILTSFIIYLNMIFRVLETLDIFVLKEITVNNIPIFYYLLNFLISIFFIISFLILLFKEKSDK